MTHGLAPYITAAERAEPSVGVSIPHALPEQDRQCLFLRSEGLRYREIGTVLGMSLGAVSQSLARSLARISRAVGNPA